MLKGNLKCLKKVVTVRLLSILALPILFMGFSGSAQALDISEEDYLLKLLGKYAFHDANLSNPIGNQSCASCHDSATGGTHPNSFINAGQVGAIGADGVSIGGIKTPSNTYASFSTPFRVNPPADPNAPPGPPPANACGGTPGICGGNFWNGRAQGRPETLHHIDGDGNYVGSESAHIGSEVCYGLPDSRCADSYMANYESPISDQALNPFNPVEHNINRVQVCRRVRNGSYAQLYKLAWGVRPDCRTHVYTDVPGHDTTSETPADITFKRLALAIGAYQHSSEINSFSSKRDRALRAELRCDRGIANGARWVLWSPVCNSSDYVDSPGTFPLVGLSDEENLGHDLFYSVNAFGPPTFFPDPANPGENLPAAQCAFCHNSTDSDGEDLGEIYSDQAFHNLGIPFNADYGVNPYLGATGIAPDMGLAGHTGVVYGESVFGPPGTPATITEGHVGFFRTPTVRNVDKRRNHYATKAYMHNGYFKTLEGVVSFYNTGRSAPTCESLDTPILGATEAEAMAAGCWPAPEWPTSDIAPTLLAGDLGLSADHEAALVSYMEALTDRRTARSPRPYRHIKRFVRFLARIGVVH